MSHYDKERENYQEFIAKKAKEVQGMSASMVAPSPIELRVKALEERIKELEKKQG
jgi:hypothetical protein|tara:strand:- start:7529 stop:7693 length:165 start_codon:yes stop_codon:yes gene_type:complete